MRLAIDRVAPACSLALLAAAARCSAAPAPTPAAPAPLTATVPAVADASDRRPDAEIDAGTRAQDASRALGPLPAHVRERLDLLAGLCDRAIHQQDGEVAAGCVTCPPFDEPPKAGGDVAIDPELFYALHALAFGSFTRPGADQAAAVFNGCESHAGNYGGTLLVERSAGAWKAVAYFGGVNPDDCIVFRRRDRRDVIVCRWRDGHQSNWHDYVVSYDFARGTPDDLSLGWSEILQLDDDTAAACLLGDAKTHPTVRRGTADRLELADVNRDGFADLVVHVTYAKAPRGRAFEDRCAELIASLEQEGAPAVDITPALGPQARYRLEFVHDGKAFVPTPATARRMKTF
jgi:hypothetical protein